MNKDDWLTQCHDRVYRLDRDRLMCATLAPAPEKEALVALLAFNLEIATIPELVSEALLGEMRLQWWRDTLDSLYAGKHVAHPVALGLTDALARYGLSKNLFDDFLEARSFDLQGRPPASMAVLESYVEGTAGALNELMAEVLGIAALSLDVQGDVRAAARHAGIAWALSGIILAQAFHAGQGRSYLPEDGGDNSKVGAVADAARRHIAQARGARKRIPKFLLPVMMPVVLAEHRLGRRQHQAGPMRPPGVGRLFRFYAKVLTGRY